MENKEFKKITLSLPDLSTTQLKQVIYEANKLLQGREVDNKIQHSITKQLNIKLGAIEHNIESLEEDLKSLKLASKTN